MIPAPFDYIRPDSIEAALAALAANPEAKILAGGHSLLPAMKLRLAQPPGLIDISRIQGLDEIRAVNGYIAIGSMATHAAIESAALLLEKCPLLPEVAAQIGDTQVRNRGTLGGSLAHADPAADWPAAILALDAEMEVAGPKKRRVIKAAAFFVDILQTALKSDEILVEIRVPVTARSVAYVKSAQKASGFAVAGVAAVITDGGRSVRVGITGVAAKPFRARRAENSLAGKPLTAENIASASRKAASGHEAMGDIHASAEYRSHLAVVNSRRALELAASRLA